MPFFDPRAKLAVHLFQAVLIVAAIGLSAPRLFTKNQPRTRANTIALGMGAKSLMILSYQILTEHVRRFKRWQSYKANAILNCLEIVFWAAVAFLVVQANLSRCVGIYCTLSWVVVVLAIILSISESYTAVVSIQEFRSYKARGGKKSSNGSYQENSGDEELVNRWPGRREEHGYVQHHHPKTSQQPY